MLRGGASLHQPWQRRYFRKGHHHYPYYIQRYVRGRTYISPYAFYYGFGAPYIGTTYINLYPPLNTFVDLPVYSGSTFTQFYDADATNYLDDPNLDQNEPGLVNAINGLIEAFQNDDVDALVPLVDPGTSIAIYQRGRYEYSMRPNDYLDLTRDALNSMDTVEFTPMYLHRQAPNVYSLAARHVYRGSNGILQTVFTSFVLEDVGGNWTLTQVETSPGTYRNLGV